MKRIFFAIILMQISNIAYAAFLPGDILLQSAKCGVFCDSIRATTHSQIDHAAIVIVPPQTQRLAFGSKGAAMDGEIIEAWTPIAKKTPLSEFLSRDDGKYIQLRLKPEYRDKISMDDVINVAKSYIGKDYDYKFEENEDKIYCSELVYKAYEKGANIPVGKIQKISDFDKKYAKGYWTEHFHGKIPWERRVISPAGLLMTNKFDVVFSNYN